jgi:hypothetical protein
MAARLGVEVDAIEAARRSVIELTLAHQTTARVARKQAVKDLFGTLLASWEAGVSFDAMAKALNASGIDMTTETLRGYFFELKTAEQLRTENEVHEQAMVKLRQENDAKQRSRDLEHARELARVGNELASRDHAAKVEAAHQVASEVVQTARRRTAGAGQAPGRAQKLGTVGNVDQDSLPQSSPSRSNAQSGGKGASVVVERVPASTASPEPAAVLGVSVPAAGAPLAALRGVPRDEVIGKGDRAESDVGPPHAGQARTLDEVAKISQGQQESAFAENLVLKDGNTVWYESGKPFEGFLSPRTLHTLRTVGKAIAPTIGRTAKDFVPMSHEL